jgi:sulfatase modifying factor 1
VQLAGGTVTIGARAMQPDEGPPRDVVVGAFEIDRTEVTNAEFAAFVAATHYVSEAERAPDPALYPGVDPSQLRPSALVFVGADHLPAQGELDWWRVVEGASWRHPEGPGSDITQRMRHPVVQISYQDALAYAHWRGRDLPTEAEWEFAARAGLRNATFEWGDEAPSAARANYWQGVFPMLDGGDDGFKAQTAPVGCFAPSAFGLYDMTGNVWEWTKDVYADPASPSVPRHLIKGGSFLCADNFCFRFRPAARQPGPPDSGASHIGFRTVRRVASSQGKT